MKPYYVDDSVTLWHGDMRQILPGLDVAADCVVTDPPYGETSLAWDRWPDGWPDALLHVARSMWCFGSMRMFLKQGLQFGAWKLSQDIVWEKHNGSGFAGDRFKRVHEFALHWYRGDWAAIRHETPRVKATRRRGGDVMTRTQPTHTGAISSTAYVDDGSRLARSVMRVRSMHHDALHPTEKPAGILAPLIEYACPTGGLILDPFAGSGSTAVAARLTGRRAVLIEADEHYCEVIGRRLAQDVLPFGEPTKTTKKGAA